jgi:hypothetical protein
MLRHRRTRGPESRPPEANVEVLSIWSISLPGNKIDRCRSWASSRSVTMRGPASQGALRWWQGDALEAPHLNALETIRSSNCNGKSDTKPVHGSGLESEARPIRGCRCGMPGAWATPPPLGAIPSMNPSQESRVGTRPDSRAGVLHERPPYGRRCEGRAEGGEARVGRGVHHRPGPPPWRTGLACAGPSRAQSGRFSLSPAGRITGPK